MTTLREGQGDRNEFDYSKVMLERGLRESALGENETF
jgi:hypothetical protein